MIVKMRKVLIYGAKEEMDRFFSLAQRAGFLEFIGTWQKKILEIPEGVKNIFSAIKILRNWVVSGEEKYIWTGSSEPLLFAKEVVDLNRSLERHFEEKRLLNAEIARIAPFGAFSKEDLNAIQKEGNRVIQFFCRKSDLSRDTEDSPGLIFIGTEYDLDYYIAINREPTYYPKMIEIQIDKPVQELREILKKTNRETLQIEDQLRAAAFHIAVLQEGLVEYLNEHHLHVAKHDAQFPLSDVLFAIEAYIPEHQMKTLHGLLSSLTVFCEEIKIESDERIPTHMENRGLGRMGEDLVAIYDTPAIDDKDPSTWMLLFFSLFFAMIISDAGYGLIFLLIGIGLGCKFRKAKGINRRLIRLTQILGLTTTLWGVFTASFFGLEIGPQNFYRKFSLLHYFATKKAEYVMEEKGELYKHYEKEFPTVASAQNGQEFLLKASLEREGKIVYAAQDQFYDDVLLECSLLIGIFHLSLAFARYALRRVSGIGWILFMIGGYLFLPTSLLDATSILHFMGWVSKPIAHLLGKQLLFAGFGLAILASAIQNGIGKAIMEPLQAIQVFGDVLSYLRLYALGLAGVIVASTFNSLGVKFGLLIGFLIILFGHALNISLSVMAGVVHGLRLNFLEWYHYCFEGGGRRFNPLKLHKWR